ncbi:MAG: TetR/AcrR family transcriptional regulator [Ketobacteraceae bacterium]|nr:TetR/AcrR family transcriptional regulator [Ketobacteraceae bacterium]
MKTRDRILNASLRLFNQRGERNVSTNHIASELGISPGNLYYHFANKQQIVYELFLRYSQDVYEFLSVPDDRPLNFADKIRYFEATFRSIWDYRFLHRDLGHLLAENEELRMGYYGFTKRTLLNGRTVLSGLRDAGLMAMSDEQMDALMINIWVLITSWTSFLQAIAGATENEEVFSEAKIRRGIYQLIALTEPFATPGLEQDVAALKEEYLRGQSSDPLALFTGG